MDGRNRRSRGSGDEQTAQWQPIIGTPCDVPLPRNVIVTEAYQGVTMREPPFLVASMYFSRSSYNA